MNRRPSSFRTLAVAATGDTAIPAAMSFRPYFRGGSPRGSRGFSDRPLDSTNGEFVSGDSHFDAVRATNRGFRPSYRAVPPPSHYGTSQEVYGPVSHPHRPVPPVSQQLPGPGPRPRPYRHPQQAGPAFGNNQPFRPQQMRPQFRPRPSKPPDYREWEYAKPGPPPHCAREIYVLSLDYGLPTFYVSRRLIGSMTWKQNLNCVGTLAFGRLLGECLLVAFKLPYGIWFILFDTSSMRTGDPADGCAMFWRVSRFKLLHEESIEYNKVGLRDNVAQICVLESWNGLNTTGASPLSTSSTCSNRVVVCNIHVLFNPKRGDVKLGQIRLLLERAHAISKLWDHAPVVVCGDFNCTPKSPLYSFIKEQKLDLSELPRDKVSGQASAEIRLSRPPFPDYRKEAGNESIPTSEVSCDKPDQGDFPLDAQKLAGCHSTADSPSMGNNSKSDCAAVDRTSESCTGEESGSRRANGLPGQYATDSFASESPSTQYVPLHGSLTSAQIDPKPPICPTGDTDGNALSESSCIHTKATEVGEYVQSLKFPDNQSKNAGTCESMGAYNSDTSTLEDISEKVSPHSLDFACSNHMETVSAATDKHDKPSVESSSHKSLSADLVLDEKFELLSVDDSVDGAEDELHEDCETFLLELHDAGESLFSDNLDSSSANQNSHSNTDSVLNDTLYVKDETIFDARSSFSSASSWTPAEVHNATGSADCKVMEHPLKLKSAYAEVESASGSRDSSGEPLVTSYHRRFLGTVDYIWCSEGLQTKKVLAPIPKEVMQQTLGFPTKKWGSDHIALVAELAFTKIMSSQ